MEEKLNGEQSQQSANLMELAKQEQNELETDNTKDISDKCDSQFGKFKDAKSLLDAYTNLEAEFTRKSQKLAKLMEESNAKNLQQNAIDSGAQKIEYSPQYKSQDWKRKVSDFLEKNPDAKKEAKNIANILIENKELASIDGCLEIAYKMVKANSAKEPASLADSEEFLKEYIVNNPRAKELIINNYINSLNDFSSAPKLISGQAKSINAPTKNKVGSLEKAKELTLKLFT